MKGKRHKHVKKTLHFYHQNFGFEPPYTVVVDGTFCKAALQAKMNILDQLPKYLDAQVNVVTTKCILKECKAFGSVMYGPLRVLQQYDVVPCKHQKAKSAPICLMRFARKQDTRKCIIATQDEFVNASVRELPGVPFLSMVHGVVWLHNPSTASYQSEKQTIESTLQFSEHQSAVIKQLKREAFGEEPEAVTKKRKRKGPKGVNPLACKKKKKSSDTNTANVKTEDTKSPKRRKRQRKRKFGTIPSET